MVKCAAWADAPCEREALPEYEVCAEHLASALTVVEMAVIEDADETAGPR